MKDVVFQRFSGLPQKSFSVQYWLNPNFDPIEFFEGSFYLTRAGRRNGTHVSVREGVRQWRK